MKCVRRLRDQTPGLADYLRVEAQRPSWDGFRSHAGGSAYQGLIGELADLQHGLCGYCEIGLSKLDRQVEHVVPQSDPVQGASQALDCRNMIACCKGGTTRSSDLSRRLEPVKRNRSCGEAKGDHVNGEFVDPRNLPALPSLIRVLDDGRIEADVAACTSERVSAGDVTRTIEVLNLNAPRLRIQRERRWMALNDAWGELFDDTDAIRDAARTELLPVGGGLPEFFTTRRSYFGPVAERILMEQPRAWI